MPSFRDDSMLPDNILMENRYKIIMHADDEAMESCEPENDPAERNGLFSARDQAT